MRPNRKRSENEKADQITIAAAGSTAGFVAVLDKKTLAIPDRLGNNRLDTFENLLTCPDVGLIFIIPGNGDTLRVSGKGQIVRDMTEVEAVIEHSNTKRLY
jgi:uncharacterized protein